MSGSPAANLEEDLGRRVSLGERTRLGPTRMTSGRARLITASGPVRERCQEHNSERSGGPSSVTLSSRKAANALAESIQRASRERCFDVGTDDPRGRKLDYGHRPSPDSVIEGDSGSAAGRPKSGSRNPVTAVGPRPVDVSNYPSGTPNDLLTQSHVHGRRDGFLVSRKI